MIRICPAGFEVGFDDMFVLPVQDYDPIFNIREVRQPGMPEAQRREAYISDL